MRIITGHPRRPIIHSPGPRPVPIPVPIQAIGQFPQFDLSEYNQPAVNRGVRSFAAAVVIPPPGMTFCAPPLPTFEDLPLPLSIRTLPRVVPIPLPVQPSPLADQYADNQIISIEMGFSPLRVIPRATVIMGAMLDAFSDNTTPLILHVALMTAGIPPRLFIQPGPSSDQYADNQIVSVEMGLSAIRIVPKAPIIMVWRDDSGQLTDVQVVRAGTLARIIPTPSIITAYLTQDVSQDSFALQNRIVATNATAVVGPRGVLQAAGGDATTDSQPVTLRTIPRTVPIPGMTVNVTPTQVEDLPQPSVMRAIAGLSAIAPRSLIQPTISEQFYDFIPTVAPGNLGVNIPAIVVPRGVILPTPILEQFVDFVPFVTSGTRGVNISPITIITAPIYFVTGSTFQVALSVTTKLTANLSIGQ